MNDLELIKSEERYHGREVKAIHEIGDFAFIETQAQDSNGNLLEGSDYAILVNGVTVGYSIDSLDHALLIALSCKYGDPKRRDFVAWRYAARVLQMEE